MEQIHHQGTDVAEHIPDPNAHKLPSHLRNFQNNLQPRRPGHELQVHPLHPTLAQLLLPLSFLAITLLAILLVLVILYLWWRSYLSAWKHKKKVRLSDGFLVRTMAEYSPNDLAKTFKVEVVKDDTYKYPPQIDNDHSDAEGPLQSYVRYVDEQDNRICPIITTRNYGGSSPKVPEDGSLKADKGESSSSKDKFVFPPEASGSSSGSSRGPSDLVPASTSELKSIPKFMIPLPEQQWLTHKKPFDYKGYAANLAHPFAEIARTDQRKELKPDSAEAHCKKFSVTRSPSLEKDDKSPFFFSAKSDKSDCFGFDTDVIKNTCSNNSSPIVEVCVQPSSVNEEFQVLDRNFNNNVTPISPKELSEDVISICIPIDSPRNSENKNMQFRDGLSGLRRFCSVNTKLHICSISENLNLESQQEKLEVQNSPRILECSSAKEKSSGTKFNFSPKLLAENQNSPKFFTPTDNFSPKFFAEPTPKSVYYDSVRSPKFFPDTPRTPQLNDNEKSLMSPKAISDHKRNNGLQSPRFLLSAKPRSPKVHSCNKENYFTFDNGNSGTKPELIHQNSIDEVEALCSSTRRAPHLQRYAGRKSIERERFTPPVEKIDIRKYRRHNSCDTNYKNIENSNTNNPSPDINIKHKLHDPNFNNILVESGKDVVDCCIQLDSLHVTPSHDSPEHLSVNEVESDEKPMDKLTPSHLGSVHQRRQRLKSISLDSDNAKIIEQNLGLPIAKHMKQEHLDESYKDQEFSASCHDVKQPDSTTETRTIFKFDQPVSGIQNEEELIQADDSKYSPDLALQKKTLRGSSDTKSFIDMPRFSPKEFEIIVTSEEGTTITENAESKKKSSKNLRNLTIDLSRRDSDLEKELLEFEKLYTNAEEKKIKTPTLKLKANSLDSSDPKDLSLPQSKMLEVPQNSVSVPNTPKRQYKRILAQKNLVKGHGYADQVFSGAKMGYNSLQCGADPRRIYVKGQGNLLDSGIFLRENHANLMLYQPNGSRITRRMGSFDENMADFAENQPEINIPNNSDNRLSFPQHLDVNQAGLGSNLLNYKQNLSVSSTNLKTLPEGVPSNDFEPTVDEKVVKKLYRRGSNQSLMLSLDCSGGANKYSTLSLQSSNCSLNSVGASCHNLTSIRNSASNFSLNTDNRQKKLVLERRNSNTSLVLNSEHLTPTTRIICSSNASLQATTGNMNSECRVQPAKSCLLQRRGSNNSLTLNIQNSNTNLNRYSSNSSVSINKEAKSSQRKGLLERRSSNTSLTLNINTSNPQLSVSKGLSISNYNLNNSACNLSLYTSNQSIPVVGKKKGILERRSSNTSLTLNIQSQDVPRDLEIDDKLIDPNLKDQQLPPHRDGHRKSLSTENLIPKSYKSRVKSLKFSEKQCVGFGSHDNLWSNSFVADNSEDMQEGGRELTYVCGDQEEIIYAFGSRQNYEDDNYKGQGFTRNITTRPLSPQTTSEDFKMYLANIQHLQSASSVLSRQQLKDLNDVFQNGYSKVKCEGLNETGHCCSGKVEEGKDIAVDNPQLAIPEPVLPCCEYQKTLLRSLHQEFWDMPTNFQEKPMVFGSHPKNRYKTILPNEHSRFILKADTAETVEGYINANFIKGHEYAKNSYIATQGPLQNTIYDFWLMVHQTGRQSDEEITAKPASPRRSLVQKVVMLTNFIENNRQKCEKYFPLELDEEVVFQSPDTFNCSGNFFTDISSDATQIAKEDKRNNFTIKNCGMIKKTGYTIRRLKVLYNKCSNEEESTKDLCGYLKTDNDVAFSRSDVNDSSNVASESDIKVNSDVEDSRLSSEKEVAKDIAKNQTNVVTDIPKTLSHSVSDELIVYHYWFHNWADHKCPKDVNALLSLSLDVLKESHYDFDAKMSSNVENAPDCECASSKQPEPTTKFMFPPLDAPVCDTPHSVALSEVSSTVNIAQGESCTLPTIVHCSAGIGRTGCLIAILNGIKQLNYDQKVDVLGIVCNMRLNRGGMVQNSEQYELIHKVLCLYEQVCLPAL